MAFNFGPKINVRISKKAYIYLILCLLPVFINAQKKDAKKIEERKEQLRIEREKAAEVQREAGLKHHFEIQTKNVQKRMKQNIRSTNKYYNRKLGLTFFQKLFPEKKKRKRK
jgi:hypothetical protein